MAFVTDSNRPQRLRQPPPTTCRTAPGAASEAPSLLTHPCPPHTPEHRVHQSTPEVTTSKSAPPLIPPPIPSTAPKSWCLGAWFAPERPLRERMSASHSSRFPSLQSDPEDGFSRDRCITPLCMAFPRHPRAALEGRDLRGGPRSGEAGGWRRLPKRLGRLLSVTNAIEAGACRQGDGGWA